MTLEVSRSFTFAFIHYYHYLHWWCRLPAATFLFTHAWDGQPLFSYRWTSQTPAVVGGKERRVPMSTGVLGGRRWEWQTWLSILIPPHYYTASTPCSPAADVHQLVSRATGRRMLLLVRLGTLHDNSCNPSTRPLLREYSLVSNACTCRVGWV